MQHKARTVNSRVNSVDKPLQNMPPPRGKRIPPEFRFNMTGELIRGLTRKYSSRSFLRGAT